MDQPSPTVPVVAVSVLLAILLLLDLALATDPLILLAFLPLAIWAALVLLKERH